MYKSGIRAVDVVKVVLAWSGSIKHVLVTICSRVRRVDPLVRQWIWTSKPGAKLAVASRFAGD